MEGKSRMIKTIKNKSAHIITLKTGVIMPHKTKTIEINEKETKKYTDKIEYEDKVVNPVEEEKPKEEPIPDELAKPKEEKKGIINEHITDNYLGKNTRGVLNDLSEDQKEFTKEDLDLLHDYESKHKNRTKILDRIKKIKESD